VDLITALQIESARNKKLIALYRECPAGGLAAALMEAEIETAKRAINEGDTVQMVRSLVALRGNHE
jgi:hypothetical protein